MFVLILKDKRDSAGYQQLEMLACRFLTLGTNHVGPMDQETAAVLETGVGTRECCHPLLDVDHEKCFLGLATCATGLGGPVEHPVEHPVFAGLSQGNSVCQFHICQ